MVLKLRDLLSEREDCFTVADQVIGGGEKGEKSVWRERERF